MKNLKFDINLNLGLGNKGAGVNLDWGINRNGAGDADEIARLTLAMEMLVEKNKHLESENKRLGKELEVANNAPRSTKRTFMDNAKEGAIMGEIMLLKKQNQELSDALIKANKTIEKLKDSKATNVETTTNGFAEKEMNELKHTLMQKENEISRLVGIVDTQVGDIHELTNVVSSLTKIVDNMVFPDKGGEFVKHQEPDSVNFINGVNEVNEDSSSSVPTEEEAGEVIIVDDDPAVEDEVLVVNDKAPVKEDEPVIPKKHRSEWIPNSDDVEKITLDNYESFIDYGLHITKDNGRKNKPVGKAPKVSDEDDIIIE